MDSFDVEGDPGILDVVTGQVLWTQSCRLVSPPEAAVKIALLLFLPEVLQPGVERVQRVRLYSKDTQSVLLVIMHWILRASILKHLSLQKEFYLHHHHHHHHLSLQKLFYLHHHHRRRRRRRRRRQHHHRHLADFYSRLVSCNGLHNSIVRTHGTIRWKYKLRQ